MLMPQSPSRLPQPEQLHKQCLAFNGIGEGIAVQNGKVRLQRLFHYRLQPAAARDRARVDAYGSSSRVNAAVDCARGDWPAPVGHAALRARR